MRSIAAALTMLLALTAALGGVDLVEDAPSSPKSQVGRIVGRILLPTTAPAATTRPAGASGGGLRLDDQGASRSRSDQVVSLKAVSRATGKTFLPESFDQRTGRFSFENMPGAATYDICLRTAGGREIEGIDLDFVDQRLVDLAAGRRKQLGLKSERSHAFSERDAKALIDFVGGMDDFMEDRRVLYIRGHGPRATMLVELMRTRKFHASGPADYIWRIELWYFVEYFGGWDRLANQERLLRRVRGDREHWRRISIEYYPQLSVRISPLGKADPVEFSIPAKSDPSRGRTPGTKAKIKTPPHILGLDVKKAGPASLPATQPTAGRSALGRSHRDEGILP